MPTKYTVLDEEKSGVDDQIVTDEPPIEEVKPSKAQERFPMKELIVMYMITASDSVALTVIGPFVPGRSTNVNTLIRTDLCRYRFGIQEEFVGIAAGLLIGGFSLAVFLSSFFIGYFYAYLVFYSLGIYPIFMVASRYY
jgi:hypothetical protein